MKLSTAEMERYQRDGFLLFPELFSAQEISLLRDEVERVSRIEAPAGSITVHNCRTVHGSPASSRADGRPLLLNAYTSADAFPYTPHPQPSSHSGKVVRGGPARWAHHDPRPCLIPPDWSGGYTSIFAAQAGEEASGEHAGAEG